ncbi:hypothetical protein GCM10017673_32810 [Streptosporangium violaceochromogenes]|nr:hypothetical protein GCM10017673_32810 [Streptosporangium violaceochromogenes]
MQMRPAGDDAAGPWRGAVARRPARRPAGGRDRSPPREEARRAGRGGGGNRRRNFTGRFPVKEKSAGPAPRSDEAPTAKAGPLASLSA